ncbi:MAG: pilus assembly protein N-terminal domain-containing protein [Candidatus Eremiobacteraeota bacterium]|nr:pilus assembly protein N-terminal domain-containing protein [Candidatus Eremiobacteraeota bacterium]
MLSAFLAAGLLAAFPLALVAQTQEQPTPPPSAPVATSVPLGTPTPIPVGTPIPTTTAVPITVDPQSAGVPVGGTAIVHASGIFGDATVTVSSPALLDASIDQGTRIITLSGKAIGVTTVTVKDARGQTRDVPVRVAYNAGTIAEGTVIHTTGDPASAEFLRTMAAAAAAKLARPRPGATVIAPPDGLGVPASLQQDNVVDVAVPVLIQGHDMFSVQGTTHVRIYNDAAPRISPDELTVSDFPERLTENGELFTRELERGVPTRFLYFHYNPADQPARRIVLRAQNASGEPALVQFISGSAADTNEMAAGHDSTERFLVRLVQNEGSLITIPGNSSINLVEQDLPPKYVVSNLLQLRVLNGSNVHLTLFAQNAADDPNVPLGAETLLTSTVRHARGIYSIPEFKQPATWSTTDSYLELRIGEVPVPNELHGEALSGDYGVLQSFVVKIQNPTSSPQPIAIYENPRGGRATGTYLIDGVLIRSHGVPAFSRYKIRQYVVPAKGYIRVTIRTIPEAGSSYPLRLVFAPDDGSVAPGAPGSPVY